MIFRNREEAGRLLADALRHLGPEAPVVLALPRGGVPVAFEISKLLRTPLDVALVRKIGVPWQPELALGAVADGPNPEIVVDQTLQATLGIDDEYLREEKTRQLAEIERRQALYRQGSPPIEVQERTVIVVDDGIATGATVRAALRFLRRRKPRRLVLAVPVAPPDTLETLRGEADEIVCLQMPEEMGAVGLYYKDFSQVSDREVVMLLERARRTAADG